MRLFLLVPSTTVLLGILAFGTANAAGWIPFGPFTHVMLMPASGVSRLMDMVGVAAAQVGLPCPEALRVVILVIGSVLLDWTMRRAME
jgi:hypothetical protein